MQYVGQVKKPDKQGKILDRDLLFVLIFSTHLVWLRAFA